jgi:photosystem II stability/assembly factor-like uncharacterized protein
MKSFIICVFLLLLSENRLFAQWTSQLQGGTGSYLSIHFADASSGFVTGSRFQFSKTTNGGNQWVSQNANAGPEELTSVFMTSPNDIYLIIKAVGTNNLDQLFISRDGGVNFIRNRYGVFHTVYFQNASTGYCVGPSGTMIKTDDAGQRWNQLSTGTTQLIADVYFPDSQNGFIVGENGLLRKTVNAGASWQALNPGSSASLSAVHFTSSTTGYCVGANGTALRTQNGGLTWNAMPVGAAVNFHDVLFTSPLRGFIAGDFGTLLTTIDGGATWVPEASNTFENLNALATAPDGRVWAAGDNGTVLVRASVITNTTQSLAATTYELYPNPITNYLTVDLRTPSTGPISINVKDITGRSVISEHRNGTVAAQLSLSTEALQPGMYMVEITSMAGTWTKKCMKAE